MIKFQRKIWLVGGTEFVVMSIFGFFRNFKFKTGGNFQLVTRCIVKRFSVN